MRDGQATNAVFDNANRLLEDAEFTYVYDNNGNLISKTNKANFQVTTYIYDAENQLTQVNKTGMSATYSYDGLGRRIEKNVNGVKTRYVYDGQDILLEFNQAATLLARYTHGPGIDEPLIMERGGQSYFYNADGLGSKTELVNSTGAVSNSFVYDSFGSIASQSGTVVNPYSYTGREYDSESGLYYYRARYYDARIGRFISEDPIGFEGGVNFYTYVDNNPINRVDPFGLQNQRCDEGCLDCSRRLRREGRDQYPRPNEDNFMRHCWVSCETSKQCIGGRLCSFLGGWWNEIRGGAYGGSRAFEWRDVVANDEGRNCSSKGKSCVQCCLDKKNGYTN